MYARPFAVAIAGSHISTHFVEHSRAFHVTYTMNPDLGRNVPTRVFLPPRRYPEGMSTSIRKMKALYVSHKTHTLSLSHIYIYISCVSLYRFLHSMHLHGM